MNLKKKENQGVFIRCSYVLYVLATPELNFVHMYMYMYMNIAGSYDRPEMKSHHNSTGNSDAVNRIDNDVYYQLLSSDVDRTQRRISLAIDSEADQLRRVH